MTKLLLYELGKMKLDPKMQIFIRTKIETISVNFKSEQAHSIRNFTAICTYLLYAGVMQKTKFEIGIKKIILNCISL